MPNGVESDPLVWKLIAGLFALLASFFGYFVKKRDNQIEENTKEVTGLRQEVAVMQAHMESFAADQGEMKDSMKGVVDCVQEIRIHLAGLPCGKKKTKCDE
ncbi:hypothetical protein N9937_00445 [bacterium]|nr:hypothetical protein [bacterium]